MPLTPLDAEKTKFRIGFRGYAREDVEHFRAMVLAALEDHITRTQQLDAKVAELESQLDRYHEKEELLKNSVVLAQRTCDELIAAAHQRADAIKQEAMQEGNRIRQELSELRSQREQFEYAFHGLLTGFKHRLEQGNPQLMAAKPSPQLEDGSQPVGERKQPVPGDAEAGAVKPLPAEIEAAEQPLEEPLPAISIPSVPDIPAVKPLRDVPSVPSTLDSKPRPTAGGEVDRDADIADFSAALDVAPANAPPWPQPPAVTPEDAVGDEPVADEEQGAEHFGQI